MSESSQNPIDSGASLSNYGGDEENSHSPSLIQVSHKKKCDQLGLMKLKS